MYFDKLSAIPFYRNVTIDVFDEFKFDSIVLQFDHPVVYPNIVRDPITNNVLLFYRWFGDNVVEMYVSLDGKNFKKRNNYRLKRGMSTHNLIFFNDDKNNMAIKAIGGRHERATIEDGDAINIKKINKNCFSAMSYKFPWAQSGLVHSHLRKCPHYANGLYCFEYKNYKLINMNNDMPIISGLHKNRFDGIYGTIGFDYVTDINKHRNNGFSFFDGAHNIIYDGKKYILYARANVSYATRLIQYSTSDDLVHCSSF